MQPNRRRQPLPVEPRERTLELVRRSEASPTAPPTGLPDELDEMVRAGERRRALLYAQFDDACDRCDRLTDIIDNTGIVITVIDPEDEDSLVQSVDDLRSGYDSVISLPH